MEAKIFNLLLIINLPIALLGANIAPTAEKEARVPLPQTTYGEIVNSTPLDITNIDLSQIDNADFGSPSVWDGFYHHSIKAYTTRNQKIMIGLYMKNCPWRADLTFQDGTTAFFKINQQFARSGSEAGFSSGGGNYNIDYTNSAKHGTTTMTVRFTQERSERPRRLTNEALQALERQDFGMATARINEAEKWTYDEYTRKFVKDARFTVYKTYAEWLYQNGVAEISKHQDLALARKLFKDSLTNIRTAEVISKTPETNMYDTLSEYLSKAAKF